MKYRADPPVVGLVTMVESALTVGRYAIDEWLASGASGVIFRAHDPVLDRPVAIKSLRRELAKGSAGQRWNERFRRRARAAGSLFHPNIITVLDFGEDHDVPFIAMEYVEGLRLDRLLRDAGPLAPPRATALILKILEALEYSHERGVAHLDLKPSIVLVLANDRVKVAGFGAALTDTLEPANIGESAETAACITPERLAGGLGDRRSDLFATGALLFEMLTGTKPFHGATVAEVMAQIQAGQVRDLRALNPEAPSALRDIISTALAFDPARRFASADEFAHALNDAVSLKNGSRTGAHRTVEPGFPGWDSEALRKVEADLAIHIGPVAPFAVRRAARRAEDLVALYQEAATFIENEQERAEFLRNGLRFAGDAPDRRAFAAPDEGPGAHPAWADLRPARPEAATVEALEAELAQYIGPIAKVLVKQELQDFRSMPEMVHNLADHIADDAERAAFLNWARG